jgi:UPF0755 protein
MRAVLITGLALGVLTGGAMAGGYLWVDAVIHERTPEAPEVELKIPKGASTRAVGRLLVEEGLVSDGRALELWLRLGPGVPGPKAGRHLVSATMTVPELFAALAETPLPEDVPVTLVEGWRLADADRALAEEDRLEPGLYLKAASSTVGYRIPFPVEGDTLAGYLLPDTYMVPPGPIDPRALVQRQLDAFAERFWSPHREEIEASGRSLRTLVILASLLEREEPKPEVRPKVAGVLYNRLDADTPLGVDATSRYELEDWSDRRAFLKKLRDPTDPWNTRLKPGLPPGPIGAPSLPSLLAALRPEPTDAWYYLHDDQQRIHFSRTAEEHEAKRRKYDVW